MTKSAKNTILKILKVTIPLGIGVYLMWYFYQSMDAETKDVFYNALGRANYFYITLSIVFGILSHLLRAYRWKYLLEPLGYKPKFLNRFYTVMAGYLINLLLPRAGEASRAALLYQSDGIPFSKSFGTIIAERVFDTLALGIILLVALFLSYDDIITIRNILISNSTESESGVSLWILYGILGFVLLIGVIFIFVYFKVERFRLMVQSFGKDLLNGVFAIFKSKNPYKFTFQTMLIWILYLFYFGICFFAFEETKDFPINGILIGFIAGTFGIAFTNGGIGAYPYLVSIVVIFYMGQSTFSSSEIEGVGKALGMIIWLSQTVMMIVLGLFSLILIPRKFKKKSNDKVGEN